MKKILSTLLLFFAVIGVHAADLYLAYDNGGGWKTEKMSQNGTTYTCDIETAANQEFAFRFQKISDVIKDVWGSGNYNSNLIAPSATTEITLNNSYSGIANQYAECWKIKRSEATTYRVNVTATDIDHISFTVSTVSSTPATKPDKFYLVANGYGYASGNPKEMTASGNLFTLQDVVFSNGGTTYFRFASSSSTSNDAYGSGTQNVSPSTSTSVHKGDSNNWSIADGTYDITVDFTDPAAPTLTIIRSSDRPVKPDKFYLVANGYGYASGNPKEMTASGNLFTLTKVKFSNGGTTWFRFASSSSTSNDAYGSGTANVSPSTSTSVHKGDSNNWEIADGTYDITVDFTNLADPKLTITDSNAAKEIFMVYRNMINGNTSYRIAEATTTTEATRNGRQVTLYSFNVPVYNNDQLRWKFLSNKNGNYNTKNDELFAPTDNRIPRNIPVNANEGAAYWYILPNFDGMATVSAWYTNDDQTRLNLEYKVTYYERPRKGNFFYSTDGGDTWLMVPNRAIVEGEYTQWNVSIAGTAGMEVRFRLDGLDGAQYFINETKELSDANYLFADFKTTQSGVFKFKDNSTYQFLIRKFDDVEVDKNQTISYEYEIAARKVNKDNNFTEFAFTVNANHHESYTMTPVTVDLENMKAAASFTALMSYDQDTGTMTLNPDTAGQTTEIHWVKYEHPFWEARSASSMEYADAKGNKQDVAVALWWSDTYLHPNDPRVKAWFPEKVDELANRKSVDKITDPSFKPQTSGGCLTYYRAYVTMKKVYVELPSNGPQRAVVNSQFAGNYGTRVAYAAELPQESTADIVSGVEEVAVDSEAAFDGEAEYFTISGIRVYGDPAPGLYIVRRGNKVTKEIVK